MSSKCRSELDRSIVESLVGKEKWLAHVAPQLNRHLSSAYALLRSRGSSRRVTPGSAFVSAQRAIAEAIPTLQDVPLVPRSAFPPMCEPGHVLVFQDACETGHGGWFVTDLHLFYFAEPWPEHLVAALTARPRHWYMSHAELLAEAIAVDAVIAMVPNVSFITDLTDNEAARAAANRGTSTSPGMAAPAVAIDDALLRADVTMRTVRVTTTENAVADALSRGALESATAAAALLGLTPRRIRIEPDAPVYNLAVLD